MSLLRIEPHPSSYDDCRRSVERVWLTALHSVITGRAIQPWELLSTRTRAPLIRSPLQGLLLRSPVPEQLEQVVSSGDEMSFRINLL